MLRLLCGLIILLPALSFAHGDAQWIQMGKYVDQWGIHCCGEMDCAIAQPGELRHQNGGWLHVPTNTFIPDDRAGVYPSIDAQMWRCVRDGVLKCVFPAAGV